MQLYEKKQKKKKQTTTTTTPDCQDHFLMKEK